MQELCNKTIWNVDDLSHYTGFSKSYIHKLTMKRVLPFSKPVGKCIFFKREDIERWLMSNPVATSTEIQDTANRILMEKGGGL